MVESESVNKGSKKTKTEKQRENNEKGGGELKLKLNLENPDLKEIIMNCRTINIQQSYFHSKFEVRGQNCVGMVIIHSEEIYKITSMMTITKPSQTINYEHTLGEI